MIDLHSHVLAGIDDGPETIEGSLELARAVAAAGTRTLVATPHVSWRYPNDFDTIARGVAELNALLQEEGTLLEVRTGAEIAMTRAAEVGEAQLALMGLGGGPWLLVEPPFTPVVTGLDALVLDLQRQGHRIVLAHPERCPAFHRDRRMLESLVRSGVLTSITAGSLVGSFGGQVRSFALQLVQDELVHNVASDAHDPVRRPPGIRDELEQAGLGALTSGSPWRCPPRSSTAGRSHPARP